MALIYHENYFEIEMQSLLSCLEDLREINVVLRRVAFIASGK